MSQQNKTPEPIPTLSFDALASRLAANGIPCSPRWAREVVRQNPKLITPHRLSHKNVKFTEADADALILHLKGEAHSETMPHGKAANGRGASKRGAGKARK